MVLSQSLLSYAKASMPYYLMQYCYFDLKFMRSIFGGESCHEHWSQTYFQLIFYIPNHETLLYIYFFFHSNLLIRK